MPVHHFWIQFISSGSVPVSRRSRNDGNSSAGMLLKASLNAGRSHRPLIPSTHISQVFVEMNPLRRRSNRMAPSATAGRRSSTPSVTPGRSASMASGPRTMQRLHARLTSPGLVIRSRWYRAQALNPPAGRHPDALAGGFTKYGISEALEQYLRDVADHTARANERIDGVRFIVRDIHTINATFVTQLQNEEMKHLAEVRLLSLRGCGACAPGRARACGGFRGRRAGCRRGRAGGSASGVPAGCLLTIRNRRAAGHRPCP